jgi:hypothetical protein
MDRKEIKEKLWELHKALVEFFIEQLKDPDVEVKGTTLDVMRSFLRDNKITLPDSDMVQGDNKDWDKMMSDLENLGNLEDPEHIREQVKEEQEDDRKPRLKIFQ